MPINHWIINGSRDHSVYAPSQWETALLCNAITVTPSLIGWAHTQNDPCGRVPLTHWGRDNMAAISQTTLSNAFSWMKMLEPMMVRLPTHICVTRPQWVQCARQGNERFTFSIVIQIIDGNIHYYCYFTKGIILKLYMSIDSCNMARATTCIDRVMQHGITKTQISSCRIWGTIILKILVITWFIFVFVSRYHKIYGCLAVRFNEKGVVLTA